MAVPISNAELGDAAVGDSDTMTYEAGEAITAGDAVAINAGQLATADGTTDTNIIGIAGEDASAAGEKITVHVGGLVVANCAGTVTAGTELGTSATEGQLASGSAGIEAVTDSGAMAGLQSGFTLGTNAAVVRL